jgi:hypothetical protein
LVALKELDLKQKAQSDAKLNELRNVLTDNKKRFNQAILTRTKNPAIVETIEQIRELKMKIRDSKVNRSSEEKLLIERENRMLWDKNKQSLIDM